METICWEAIAFDAIEITFDNKKIELSDLTFENRILRFTIVPISE